MPRIHAAGGELVIIGNGTPEQAGWFVADFTITTPVFTDPSLAVYKAAGTKKPAFLDPRSFLMSLRAMRKGYRQTKTQGKALQNGGVFVITPSGEVPYRYISDYAGDHPDPEAPVAALESIGVTE